VPENDISEGLSTKALDTIDTVVATVNDKAIRPAIVAARGVVFGVIIAVVALAVLVLASVMVVRVITVGTGHVWISDLALGSLFCAGGAFLYAKRGVTPDA
jgi:hypothetical protein